MKKRKAINIDKFNRDLQKVALVEPTASESTIAEIKKMLEEYKNRSNNPN